MSILVDGHALDCVSALDRGLAYGDGVFRTLKTCDGKAVWWNDQYAKLAHDCQALSLDCPDAEVLQREIESLALRLTAGAVKIIVTRGVGPRGYAIPESASPIRVVIASRLPDHAVPAADGIALRWCALRLSRQPRLAGIKHLNRLENVLARSEWHDPAISEGLLCDDTNAVIGGTMSNLFIVRDGRIYTPDLTTAGIAGVARSRVLRAAARHGIDSGIGRIEPAEVMAADEIFLTSSIVGIWPVMQLDDKKWVPGQLTGQFKHWIDEAD